jgi:tRNA threonylcarbamoyladenosine biosynthesis protein TsaE
MATLISNSPEETSRLGEQWGREATRGLVIGLTGELGAGKTTLVQGIARGLGITSRVTSPSFALVNIHDQGRLPLFHLDLYRLDTREQIAAAGLEPYLCHPAGLAVVEWMERWTGPASRDASQAAACAGLSGLQGGYRLVLLETVTETIRRITYEDTGA